MTKEETLKWFNEVAIPFIETYKGLFSTFYYVYQDENNPYAFYIEYQPWSCESVIDGGCEECPYRTSRGNCGEYCCCIKDDGTIYYEGKVYSDYNEFLNEFS